ncbi:hypothetical protein [Hymenobacter rubidus]|uniref:hypothetical protein n=1 Tax=Hymenobacter rubidus TaxID=1441626 RepID=UPI00191CF2F7|nr:hypothetical protein [Hymenobacter rubidus]
MPKLIDYPRTSYTGAWELAEITDDTGGKCAIETAARKLNRKVSGSFKAIIGSAVKFGLLTSKRDMLTTTTLFKRIKHAYDKQEELVFHREAFLTPPLFTQICRKFRSRELPIQMLDVMLIREFGVEEINAQSVAKAFVDGCRMVGLIDERNIIADIDALNLQKGPRRELASPPAPLNTFRPELLPATGDSVASDTEATTPSGQVSVPLESTDYIRPVQPVRQEQPTQQDAIASLFGLLDNDTTPSPKGYPIAPPLQTATAITNTPATKTTEQKPDTPAIAAAPVIEPIGYQVQISGPGVNTILSITDDEDIALAIALLEKIRRQLRS